MASCCMYVCVGDVLGYNTVNYYDCGWCHIQKCLFLVPDASDTVELASDELSLSSPHL